MGISSVRGLRVLRYVRLASISLGGLLKFGDRLTNKAHRNLGLDIVYIDFEPEQSGLRA